MFWRTRAISAIMPKPLGWQSNIYGDCSRRQRSEKGWRQPKSRKIPWREIGEPLAELLRYEREIGYYEHAGHALLSTIVHETEGSAWRQFLLVDNNFGAVVGQVIAISDKESKNPQAVLNSIRKVVNAAYTHAPKKAEPFLQTYLKYRPSFPCPIREQLDTLSMRGKRRVALRAMLSQRRWSVSDHFSHTVKWHQRCLNTGTNKFCKGA